jgi:hypothetical protein
MKKRYNIITENTPKIDFDRFQILDLEEIRFCLLRSKYLIKIAAEAVKLGDLEKYSKYSKLAANCKLRGLFWSETGSDAFLHLVSISDPPPSGDSKEFHHWLNECSSLIRNSLKVFKHEGVLTRRESKRLGIKLLNKN